MKRLWHLFLSLSRFHQIGCSVLAAHALIVIMLAIHHMTGRSLNPKKAIAIRTTFATAASPRKEPAVDPPESAKKDQEKKTANSRKQVSAQESAVAKKEVKKSVSKPPATSPKNGAVLSGAGKKTSPEIGKESAIDNEILHQIAESLGTLSASTKVSQQSNFKVSLPPSIQIRAEAKSSFDRPGYGELVSAILQNSLDLPEFGQVIAKIEIAANGDVTQCEILETRSRKNAEFLKKRLQELAFPCFNEFGLLEPRLTFTITFHNAENP